MDLAGKLVFDSNIYAYILVFILLPVSILYRSKLYGTGRYNPDYLSRGATDCVKGIAIFVVIIHHFSQRIADTGHLYLFTRFGYLSVSVFFFLSGYSLMKSLLKNSGYLDGFIRKRLSRVYLPLVIINALTLLLFHYIYGREYGIRDIIMFVTGLRLADSVLWFVNAIILFYLVFFIAFRFFSLHAGPVLVLVYSAVYFIVCSLTGFGDWWYTTCFCFPLGIFAAKHYEKMTMFLGRNHRAVSLAAAVIFPLTFYWANWYVFPGYSTLFYVISSIACVFALLVVLMKIEINNTLWLFAGAISYEMYLVHMKVFNIYFNHVHITGGYSLYIFIAAVVITAYLFSRFFDMITRLLQQPASSDAAEAEAEG